jgi:aspartate aminotransferase
VVAETDPTMLPDIEELGRKIGPCTRMVILNSPNNPSGRVYSVTSLQEIARLLRIKNREIGHPIYLLSDEPYHKILFDGIRFESPLRFYPWTIVATSFSKDLSLAGERIGYLAVNPEIEDAEKILNAATFCNRILGYVNAPALMQRVIPYVLDVAIDADHYQRRRDLLYNALISYGYEVVKPEGAFYLFPKCPIDNDIAFVQALQEEFILTTPGTGFHRSGYIRIAYCVAEDVIRKALPGFRKIFNRFKA